MSLHQISAIIRLTHKYHVEDLLRQALSALKDAVPSRFKDFEDGFDTLPVQFTKPRLEAIAVNNLARLTETHSVLPLNLYACCALGPALLDGWEREDGTIEYLSTADLKRCIGGREALAQETFTLVSVIFKPEPNDDCRSPTACQEALRMTLAKALEIEGVAQPYVLDSWVGFIRENGQPRVGAGYCYACQRELLERDLRERRRVWDRLPEIFDVDVPNWNQDPEPQGGQGGGENLDGNGGD